jgi:hypothetical protein
MKNPGITGYHLIGKYKIYLLIALPIILFNLIAVFGIDVLLQDDAFRYYYRAVNGTSFRFEFRFIHFFISTITHGITFDIMYISPVLIRGIYVLFVMVPLSCLLYNLFQKKMGFPGTAAYCAAVLPNILPEQHHIPAFINGSHVLLGLMMVVATLFACFNYLDNRDQKSWKMLLVPPFIYFLATLVTDQPVFSFPVLVFALWGYQRLTRRHLFLAASFFLVFLHKSTWMFLLPRGTSRLISPTLPKIFERAGKWFQSMLPMPKFLREDGIIPVIIFVLIIGTGLVLALKNRDEGFKRLKPFSHLSHKTFILYIYGFLLVWVISNIIVFITFSPISYQVRYGYYAAYGFTALLALSLYFILKKIFPQKKIWIYLLFSFLIVVSGISRFNELKTNYDKLNKNQAKIIKNLNSFKFPEHSQIVLYLADPRNFWGDWYQSGGHWKYMLKRKDIDGLIGSKKRKYYNFYDPFDMDLRGFLPNHSMRGLDINRPIFFFVEKNKKFKQYQYALQWKGKKGEPGSRWTLFHFDKKTGKASSFLTGRGIDSYNSALKDLQGRGISQTDILWGGQGL